MRKRESGFSPRLGEAVLNTTQTTNPSCVTRTEPLTAAEKEFREHSIQGHRSKSKIHVDKSCQECMTPTRQALRCQKEGALEEPDIESVDEEEEDEEMGIHTMDKCTSCDRLTDTQCMNLLCEWCCESQDCECIAVPIPKPRSMIATRGTDTVSRPNYWSNHGFELCGARTMHGMACKNAKASCRHHRIYQPESELCMAAGCYNQRALDPSGGMDNPGKSYEYCSRYCARTSMGLPEEQTTEELYDHSCNPAPDCAVINCYNKAWFDKRKRSFSLGCTRSHTEHAKLSYSSCRALAGNTSVPVGSDEHQYVIVVQKVVQDTDQALQNWCSDMDCSNDQMTG